jgi:hypothetical protein
LRINGFNYGWKSKHKEAFTGNTEGDIRELQGL